MQNRASLKRIVIACGGTGGHFYPGYTLAKALRDKGWETLFLLRRDDPAAATLTRDDLPFVEIDLKGMPRVVSARWLTFPFQVLKSLRTTRNVLRSYQPRCVLGMGGYLTFPTVLSAWRLGIPSMIHEANSILGLANRLCRPFVSKVALGLPLADSRNGTGPFELTGIPIRPEFWKMQDTGSARESFGLDPKKPTILLFGGSQGARPINQLAPAAIRELAERRPNAFQCLHISGPNDEAAVKSAYAGAKLKAVVIAYLNEIYRADAAADIILSRSGASTLAELVASRKPAILIPLPFATGGHQDFNANILSNAGAAMTFRQSDLTSSILAKALEDLLFLDYPKRISKMAQNYGKLNMPAPQDCLNHLVRMVESL